MDAVSQKWWSDYFEPVAKHITDFKLVTPSQYMIARFTNNRSIRFSINADKELLLYIYGEWMIMKLFKDNFIRFLTEYSTTKTNKDACFLNLLLPMFPAADYMVNIAVEKLILLGLENMKKTDMKVYQEYISIYTQKIYHLTQS